MKILKRLGYLCLTLTALSACTGGNTVKSDSAGSSDMTQTQTDSDIIVDISTTLGDIQVRLFGDTPGHRDNFAKLADEGYYNGTLFHRVINDFMVQAGDPDSRNAPAGKMLGEGDPGYTLAAEIDYPRHYHK
ncbi:MAG: peptidylprolyl isomerase, partial [Muribaculaceae bacterium]|nr:peptidylprolyl isomerase [Muribaculaceae bacterium]